MSKINLEVTDIGCAEKLVTYHGVKVGGWVPETGNFREWGADKISVNLPTKRDLAIFVVARYGVIESFAKASA